MKTYRYFIVIISSFVITACSTDVMTNEIEEKPIPLRIGAVIDDNQIEVTTRAQSIWFNSFPAGTTVLPFYIKNDQTGQYFPEGCDENTPYELTSLTQGNSHLYPETEYIQYMGFNVPSTLVYPAGCTSVSIHSMHPKTVTNSTESFTVNDDQTENAAYQASDLLFADTANVPRTAYPIILKFKHQMAKIIVNLQGTEQNNITELSLQGIYRTINISPSTSQLGSLSGEKGSVIISQKTPNIMTSTAAVIPPQSTGDGYFIKAITSAGKIAYFRSPSGNQFKSGKVYTFNLTINSTDFGNTGVCYKDLNSTGGISSVPVAFFNYTGVIQRFVVPETGNYQLEVWGAKGGVAGQTASGLRSFGGAGGYTKGVYYLTAGTVLYVVVGGSGVDIDADGVPCLGGPGGFNGGGDGGNGYSAVAGGGGGGGATHIALADGVLSSLDNNRDAVLVVAGGGGGGSWTYDQQAASSYNFDRGNGGYGGGTIGGRGTLNTITNGAATGLSYNNSWHSEISKAVTGSTDGGGQDYGFSFGMGQNGRNATLSWGYGGEGGGGGGGGWYGGYAYNSGYYEVTQAQTRELPVIAVKEGKTNIEPDNDLFTDQDSLCRWITDSYDKLTSAQKTIVEQTKSRYTSVVGSIWFKNGLGQNSNAGGGGGSGHINTTINTATVKYVSGEMKAGNQEFQSPNGDTVIGNNGPGVARITKL